MQIFLNRTNLVNLNVPKINYDKLVIFLAVLLSIISVIYYHSNSQVLLYNDSRSHLNISRRVVDNLTPGMVQIGSVWLPLPHILMLPFIGIDYFWKTGLAGSVISATSYIFSAVLLFKLCLMVTKNKQLSLVGFLVFALNPNMLYLQSTPMTEPLFLLLLISAAYFLYLWTAISSKNKIVYLIFSALFVMLSTLVRYDGWFVTGAMASLVTLYSLQKQKKRTEGTLIIFSFLAFFGIFLWFLWNLLIWNDALYFLHGQYSAKAQQEVISQGGGLLTKGNIFLSSYTYFWSVVNTCSLPLLLISFSSVVSLLRKSKFLLNSDSLILMILLSPLVFNVVSLFFGISTIGVPDNITHSTLFNVRYGLMVLPFIALGTSMYLKTRSILTPVALTAIAMMILVLFVNPSEVYVIKDGLVGASAYSATRDTDLKWFKDNYNGGLVLVSVSSFDPLLTEIGIDLVNYIHEGTNNYWNSALENPNTIADWIIVMQGDVIFKKSKEKISFLDKYLLVHESQDGQMKFYKKITEKNMVSTGLEY